MANLLISLIRSLFAARCSQTDAPVDDQTAASAGDQAASSAGCSAAASVCEPKPEDNGKQPVVTVGEKDVTRSGKCGKDLTWIYAGGSRTLIVSGTFGHRKFYREIHIPESATSLGVPCEGVAKVLNICYGGTKEQWEKLTRSYREHNTGNYDPFLKAAMHFAKQ